MIESLIGRLTRASLRFKWIVIALAILVLLGGVLALSQFKQELIPAIEFPQTVVLAFNNGADAEEMLEQVTIPLEEAVSDIEGVINVESTTASGFTAIILRNEFGLDQASLRADIQATLDGVDLPSEMEAPELIAFGLSDLPIAFVSISSPEFSLVELKEFVRSEVIPELEVLEDIASVQVTGGQELPESAALPAIEPTAIPSPTLEPTTEPGEESAGVPLPQDWIDLAAGQGVTLQTTDDLTAEMVAAALGVAPQLLTDLTPEMILAAPQEVVDAIPAEMIADLSTEQQEAFAERAASEVAAGGVPLPETLISAAQAQGISLETTDDLFPQLVAGIASFAPQMLAELTPEMLLSMSPEALAALPQEFLDGLEADLLDQLNALIALVPEEIPGTEELADAPALGGSWIEPPEGGQGGGPVFETAADLANSGFASTAAEFLNLLLSSGQPTAPALIGDLSVEVIEWLTEFEEGFLTNLSPAVLRLMSQDVLGSLPESFMAGLDLAFRHELEGLAAGTLEAFIPTDTINRVNGNPSLALLINKTSEANTVSSSEAVFEKLDEMASADAALHFDIVFEQASFIQESISGVAREGALGAIFAVIVILLFLSGTVSGKYKLSWRSTLVIAVSIPLSVFMAFAALRWLPPATEIALDPLAELTDGIPVVETVVALTVALFPVGITLNIMTLAGLTVAIGRVVDDSIVVLENIYRHIQRGDDQKDAVLVGTRDVSIAILASTVTTVVVFLPIGLLGGIVGQFFLPFAVAVTYALLSSFIVAVTVIPALAFMFIRKEHLPEEKETSIQRWYTPVLQWVLDHRLVTLLVAAALFVGSMALMSQLPQAFLPDFGELEISASVSLPEGTTMAETSEQVASFESDLASIPGTGTVSSEIGSSGGFQSLLIGASIDQRAASIRVGVENPEDVDQFVSEVRSTAEEAFGKENVTVSAGSLSSSGFGGLALVLSGDPEQLAAVNEQVLAELNDVEGLANATSNLGDEGMILRVDRESAVRYSGELETANTIGVTNAARKRLESIVPAGVTVSEGFESRQQTEGFQQAAGALLISVIAVYVVMMITFRSLVHPFVILFSLPMAVIGAAIALWLTDSVVGIPVMVGLMMLVGIVVTNAIVLIDRVQANRKKRGMSGREALVEGGRTRLRPILMTAIAAMLALLPLALGLSEGAIIASELATVVIGGLFSSTFLTLLIVPVMYSLLNRLRRDQAVVQEK
ncbi:MAG: efflux RND transporter permease subunit [Anaerolineales bacterium]